MKSKVKHSSSECDSHYSCRMDRDFNVPVFHGREVSWTRLFSGSYPGSWVYATDHMHQHVLVLRHRVDDWSTLRVHGLWSLGVYCPLRTVNSGFAPVGRPSSSALTDLVETLGSFAISGDLFTMGIRRIA